MRYKPFGQHTGLPVSELALGAGNLGNRWGYGADPEEARLMFKGYVEAGGNFIDTADVYQFGQSEELISDFVGPDRDHFVIASKYTSGTTAEGGLLVTGNSRKNMVRSVEGTLKRLKTDRIDFYWVHYPDEMTPIEEIVRGMEDLARSGKIVYAGLSDFPAWRASRAFTIAELRGWVPIAGMQIAYSLVERTPDRELLPMAQALGMGTCAWSVLGGGLLTGKYRRGEEGRKDTFKAFYEDESDAQRTAILDEVHAIAGELGGTPGQVAIAWVRDQGIVPIIGPRSRAQLDDNLGALTVKFSDEQLARLNAVSTIPLGFPREMINSEIERKKQSDPVLQRLDRPKIPVG